MFHKKIRNAEQVKELLRSEARLEDIARTMYNLDLRAAGGDAIKACCPFHEEKTPSFGISKSKQVYHCFGCHAKGDVFTMVQEMDSIEFMDALRKIANHVGFDMGPHEESYSPEERRLQELYNLNVDMMELAQSAGSAKVREWCSKRKLNFDIVHDAYGVGYTVNELMPEAADADQCKTLGFIEQKGKWEQRLCIPLKNHYGQIAGFRNKDIDGTSKVKIIGPSASHPLPVPEIYGLYEARRYIRNSGFLVLVEGEPDVWQMVGHGYRNVASMMGSKLTESMMATIDSLSIPLVIVMADNDEAGRKFVNALAEKKFNAKAMIKIAILAPAGDPDQILLEHGTEPIAIALGEAKYAFEYLIERTLEKYDTTRQTEKLDALNELRPHFVGSTDIVRELASRLISRLLDIDYTTIADFFREANAEVKADLHNVAAERAVLKRILTDEQFVGEALLSVKAEDFYLTKNRAVFEAVSKLYRSQQDVNESTVKTYVENKTGEPAVGLFSAIMADNVRADSAEFMLADLKDKSVRRSIQERATRTAARLSDLSIDSKQTIQLLSQELSLAISGGGARMADAGEIVQGRMAMMHERIKNPNAIIGLDMGPEFYVLNHTLHGLQRARYIVLSAASGIGKTALAGSLAKRAAVDLREPTLYCTYETGTEALVDRMVSNISGVESDKIVTGSVTREEAELVHAAAAQIASSPLVITERGVIWEECSALIRHDVLRRGTRLVIVDYIQLMSLADERGLRRDQSLGKISRGFLELAKELDITLLVVAQHNREAAKSGDTSKEGIGESYKITQDCDAMIVMREKTKEEVQAEGPDRGNRVIELSKHRHGKGNVRVNAMADLDVMRIREVRSSSTSVR